MAYITHHQPHERHGHGSDVLAAVPMYVAAGALTASIVFMSLSMLRLLENLVFSFDGLAVGLALAVAAIALERNLSNRGRRTEIESALEQRHRRSWLSLAFAIGISIPLAFNLAASW